MFWTYKHTDLCLPIRTEPPRTLLTCEPCEGYGGCEGDDGCEVECPYCHGLGAIVFEGETDTEQGEAL